MKKYQRQPEPEELNSRFKGFPGPYRIGYKVLNKILPGFSEQELATIALPPEHVYGEMNPHEIVLLSSLVRYLRPKTIFEFGTFEGLMTLNMAMNTPEDTRIKTLDQKVGASESEFDVDGLNAWYVDGDKVGTRFRGTPYEGKIEQIREDSTKFATSPFRNKMDFIFIDANHQYDFVQNDTGKAFEMLAPGGVVAWHDYGRMGEWPGVSTYLAELARSGEKLFWLEGCSERTGSPITLVTYFDQRTNG